MSSAILATHAHDAAQLGRTILRAAVAVPLVIAVCFAVASYYFVVPSNRTETE